MALLRLRMCSNAACLPSCSRPDPKPDTKAAAELMRSVCAAQGLPLRLTDKGGVQLDADACEATEHETLEDYANYTTLTAMQNNYPQKDATVRIKWRKLARRPADTVDGEPVSAVTP